MNGTDAAMMAAIAIAGMYFFILFVSFLVFCLWKIDLYLSPFFRFSDFNLTESEFDLICPIPFDKARVSKAVDKAFTASCEIVRVE